SSFHPPPRTLHSFPTRRSSDLEEPLHPYTQALVSAIPNPDPDVQKERIVLKGDVPNPATPPSGCVFYTRCPFVMDKCKTISPALDRKSTRLNSSHVSISYAVFC